MGASELLTAALTLAATSGQASQEYSNDKSHQMFQVYNEIVYAGTVGDTVRVTALLAFATNNYE